jgi:hypothetical protein
MSKYTERFAFINPQATYNFFDAIRFRLPRPLNISKIKFLRSRDCAQSLTSWRGRYIPGFDSQVWTIVAPTEEAVRLLADLQGININYAEVAHDLILRPGQPALMHDLFDAHFVHPWHGKRQAVSVSSGRKIYTGQRKYRGPTTYTGQRKYGGYHHFAWYAFGWYADRPYKLSELDCFHIEARYQGRQLLSKLGINQPRDLLTFDHQAFWAKHLRLRAIDRNRLGRWYLNRKSGSRRHYPYLHTIGDFTYNLDRATGNALYRFHAWSETQQKYTMQHFIDRYRSSPMLEGLPLHCIDLCLQMPHVFTNPHQPGTSSISDVYHAVIRKTVSNPHEMHGFDGKPHAITMSVTGSGADRVVNNAGVSTDTDVGWYVDNHELFHV